MGDICDIARGIRLSTFGIPAKSLTTARTAQSNSPAPYYLHLTLQDRPGALAKIATALGEHGISIDRMRQTKHDTTDAPVLIVTHKTQRADLDAAIQAMRASGVMAADPVALRIEMV